jgi:signal transduction histidine kinase
MEKRKKNYLTILNEKAKKDPEIAEALNWLRQYKIETEKIRDSLIIENVKQKRKINEIIDNLKFYRHDTKNSLNSVMGFSELLLESENLTKEEGEMLEYLNSSAKKVAGLVEFAGPELANYENFNLDSEIETIIKSENMFMKENRIGVNFRYTPQNIYSSKHIFTGIFNTLFASNSLIWAPENSRIEIGIREDKGNNLELLIENKTMKEKRISKGLGEGIGQKFAKGLIKNIGGEFHNYSESEIIYNANKNRYDIMKKFGSEKATNFIGECDDVYGVKIKIPMKNLRDK